MFDFLRKLFPKQADSFKKEPDSFQIPEGAKTWAGDSCPKCGTFVHSNGGHGPWCPNVVCKWGWETEMDGSRLIPPGFQAPDELRIYTAARPDDPKGGYGGLCIPDGTVLPGTINGEPTARIIGRHRINPFRPDDPLPKEPPPAGEGDPLIRPGEKHWAPHGDADFNFTKLDGVESPTSLKSASITNGYDRRVVLQGPVLTLVLQPGETRTIASPIHQRVPSVFKKGELFNPNKFSVRGYSAYQVLRDLAAESTRSMILNGGHKMPERPFDIATVDKILAVSKFTVQEL